MRQRDLKIRNRRLNQLRDCLVQVRDSIERGKKLAGAFNMVTWYEDRDCGTVACAGGYACLYEPFVQEGLTLGDTVFGREPMYRGYEAFEALKKFFKFTDSEGVFLFAEHLYTGCVTGKRGVDKVIKRVNLLLSSPGVDLTKFSKAEAKRYHLPLHWLVAN